MKRIKIIGKRKAISSSLESTNIFLKTIVQLRAGNPFIPKGVYRFKNFQEAQDWSIRMMTKNIHDHQH